MADMRFCIPCDRRYKGDQLHCPCGSNNTFPCDLDSPRQDVLFVVPPPPSPNTWIVEWRWKPVSRVKSRWQRPPADYCDSGPNPWQRLTSYNITRRATGLQIAARNRKYEPWKSFRLRPVNWEPCPLLP